MSGRTLNLESDRLRVISRQETAHLLGVSTATLHRMVVAGHLPAPIRLSTRRIGWQIGAVLDWLSAQQSKAPEVA